MTRERLEYLNKLVERIDRAKENYSGLASVFPEFKSGYAEEIEKLEKEFNEA